MLLNPPYIFYKELVVLHNNIITRNIKMLEIECKILLKENIPPASILNAPWLKNLAPQKQHLYTLYLDTPHLQLKHHRYALRIRKVQNTFIQTLKRSLSEGQHLQQRFEWENAIDNDTPDLTKLPSDIQSKLLPLIGNDSLQVIFSTQFVRHIWHYHDEQNNFIEIAFDQGEIVANGQSEDIYELELELKEGKDPSCLYTLANEIYEWLDYQPSEILASKAARGYKLASKAEALNDE